MKRKAQVQPAGSKKSKSNKPGIPGHRKDSIVKTDIAAMAANLHGVDPDELLGCVMGCVRVGWVGACGRGGVGGWVGACVVLIWMFVYFYLMFDYNDKYMI